MNRIMLAIGFVVVLAGQALAYPRYYHEQEQPYTDRYASAAPNDMAYRVGVFGTLGYSGYAMGDENQYIDQQLNSVSTLAGGKTIDHINGGLTGGLGMTFGLSEFWQIGFEYEGLGAGTSGTLAPPSNANPPLPASATISLPASEFGGFLKIIMPVENRWLFSFGVGLYNLWIDDTDTEKYTFTDGSSGSNTFYGSNLASKFWVGGEYFFTHHLSLGVDAGYRFARINYITDQNGVHLLNNDGSNFTLDYSGPFTRAGLHFYF